MFSKSKKPENKDMVVAPVPIPPKDTGSNKTEKESSTLPVENKFSQRLLHRFYQVI